MRKFKTSTFSWLNVGIWAEGSVILWPSLTSADLAAKSKGWDLSGRLGYFVTKFVFFSMNNMDFNSCWDLSGRLGYFVTVVLPWAWRSNARICWDLSGRLGYFVTNFHSNFIYFFLLGFERKARLFCDSIISFILEKKFLICWDLSGRLGYFVTKIANMTKKLLQMLGFERKARLFCDNFTSFNVFY